MTSERRGIQSQPQQGDGRNQLVRGGGSKDDNRGRSGRQGDGQQGDQSQPHSHQTSSQTLAHMRDANIRLLMRVPDSVDAQSREPSTKLQKVRAAKASWVGASPYTADVTKPVEPLTIQKKASPHTADVTKPVEPLTIRKKVSPHTAGVTDPRFEVPPPIPSDARTTSDQQRRLADARDQQRLEKAGALCEDNRRIITDWIGKDEGIQKTRSRMNPSQREAFDNSFEKALEITEKSYKTINESGSEEEKQAAFETLENCNKKLRRRFATSQKERTSRIPSVYQQITPEQKGAYNLTEDSIRMIGAIREDQWIKDALSRMHPNQKQIFNDFFKTALGNTKDLYGTINESGSEEEKQAAFETLTKSHRMIEKMYALKQEWYNMSQLSGVNIVALLDNVEDLMK